MQASHKVSAVFDEPNLIGSAGLVPVMRLAERAGLHDLLERHLSVACPNAGVKAASVVAGMLAGADSIDDLEVLRHGGLGKVFTGVRAPSTLGTFLRSFTVGHVRQLDAVAARALAGLAAVVPRLLTGTDALAFVDVDDTIREVHGYTKQGAAYGYSGVKGLNAQIAALSSPTCAPVIAAARLRKGNVVSGHGAERLIPDAVAAARAAGATGQVMVRADSGYYRQDVIAAALKARAWFSVTVRMNPSVRAAIAAIPETAWTTIKYPRAIWDHDQARWISEAQVAEVDFTAFTSHPKSRQVPCRLVVRRVERLNQATINAAEAGQEQLFTLWRHHGFVTNSTLSTVAADETHRDHAVIEQVIAELKGRAAGARPVREVQRQRRLAGLGLPRLQPPAHRRGRRVRKTRQGPLGHPAHPPGRRPGPDRDLSQTARPAPTHRLALGSRVARPLGHRHHQLTIRPQRPEEEPDVEKPDRPADPPHPHANL